MDKNKQDIFSTFLQKAEKRLEEKRTARTRLLKIPSMDEQIRIRGLSDAEVAETLDREDANDPFAGDRYSVYIATIEPDLKEMAKKLKEAGKIQQYTEVTGIFEAYEIKQIAEQIMELSGYSGKKSGSSHGKLKKLIKRDGEADFLSYYIQKGFTLEYLLGMGLAERLFFIASMRRELEEREKLLKIFLGRR